MTWLRWKLRRRRHGRDMSRWHVEVDDRGIGPLCNRWVGADEGREREADPPAKCSRCLAVRAKRERDARPKPPPKKRGRPRKPPAPLPLFEGRP